jgi:ribosomal-protein-alanine N-acetyltransferase
MRLWMAPEGLHVEPAKSGDEPILARLHAEGFFRGWPSGDFQAYLADPQFTPVLVACDPRRRIAGFLVLRLTADEAEVLSLAVARKWQGRGVGAALMRAGIEDLAMSPAKRLLLEVETGNEPALRLYRRLGFAEIAIRKAYYPKPDGSAATASVMRLDLR